MLGQWFTGIRIRLILLTAIPAFFLIICILASLIWTNRLENNLENANLVRGPKIRYSGEMMTYANGVARWTVSAMWNFQRESDRNRALKNAHQNVKAFSDTMKSYLAFPKTQQDIEAFTKIEKEWPILEQKVVQILDQLKSGQKEDLEAVEKVYVNEARSMISDLLKDLESMNALRLNTMAKEVKDENEHSNQLRLFMLTGGVFAVLISVFWSFLVLRGLLKRLNGITHELVGTTATLSSASQELSAAATEVASSSTETASSIQETVASLEELASVVKLTDENSQTSLQTTQETQSQAQLSEAKMNELIASLEDIAKSSAKVRDIIQVIDDISFQTNLLALNAAVEAARAGDQGRGFAVVAEAVRSLAQKSALSAKEIGDLIRGSVEKTNHGVQIGSECRELMTGMFESLKKVSVKSEEIAHSNREQSTGIDQISSSMNQLDRATQQNNAASEQISSSANALSQQANDLSYVVEQLKVLIDGGTSTRAPRAEIPLEDTSQFFPDKPLPVKEKSRTTTLEKNDFGLNKIA